MRNTDHRQINVFMALKMCREVMAQQHLSGEARMLRCKQARKLRLKDCSLSKSRYLRWNHFGVELFHKGTRWRCVLSGGNLGKWNLHWKGRLSILVLKEEVVRPKSFLVESWDLIRIGW